ncbi:hypothetical protein BDF22DRAFT_744525 [Syncephalis plumigaleata]|nr:hypothetical protein BDF22DRAFT_744525 [Syncephalis plumigaleata]
MAESSNTAEEQPQQLSLRVMRLSKPSLAGSSTIVEPGERLGEPLRQLDLEDPHTPALPDPDELLMLPASFGSIYLGEVFSGYLCVSNDSATMEAREVAIKAELQTSSQRIALVDTSNAPMKVLGASQTSEHVVVHEIKELGIHILVCSVQYMSLNSDGRDERRFFRRFYKFQVLNPLSVKTKVNNQANERVFLEVQVQNLTMSPMCLDRIYLEAAEGLYRVILTSYRIPAATDVRQYLFLLTLNPNINDAAVAVRSSDALGKLDIVWRTTFGEFGRLQTSQLTRRLPALERIQVMTTRVDAPVVVEQPFNIEFRVTNRSDAQMRLQLSAVRTRMGAVLLNGQASRLLGELEPGASTDVTLEFLSLESGLHPVGGLKLTDLIGGENKDIELTDVFVQHSNEPSTLVVDNS